MADPGVKIDIKAEGEQQAAQSLDSVGASLKRNFSGLNALRQGLNAAISAFTGFVGIATSAVAVVGTVATAIASLADSFTGASNRSDEARESLKRFNDEVERGARGFNKTFSTAQIDQEQAALDAVKERRAEKEKELNAILASGQRDKKVVAEVRAAKTQADEDAAAEEERIRTSFRVKRQADAAAEVRRESIDRLAGLEKINAQEAEALRVTSAMRIKLAADGDKELADAQERAIRSRFDRERSEFRKQQEEEQQRQREKDQRDKDAAEKAAQQLADALMKANEAWRKDFEEQSRAVTQELASQFQNTLAGFAGILEQQAGAARRGPWREI